jgi:fatty acid-binding protein DegV
VSVIATASDLVAATTVMASYVRAWGTGLKVAIGLADRAGAPLSDALTDALATADEIRELVSYRIGPSVGVHTGPGTAGAFFFPTAG